MLHRSRPLAARPPRRPPGRARLPARVLTAFLPAALVLLRPSLADAQASTDGTVPARRTVAPPVVLDSVSRTVRGPLEVADSLLFRAMDPGAALELLEIHLASNPRDVEALWRAARAGLVLALGQRERPDRRRLLLLADAYGDSARAAAPDDIDALTWSAASKGRLTIEVGGKRSKARRGQEVWDIAHRILELDPDHPFAHDILGKLNQEVRKLGTVQRFLARLLVGNDPIRRSTWEAAEEHLRKAVEGDPTVLLFYLDLGETYMLQGKNDEARAAFEAGLNVPDLYPTDPNFRERIGRHLRELTEGG